MSSDERRLKRIERKLNKIMATQTQEAEMLRAMKDQFMKAKGEIVGKIEALSDAVDTAGGTTPEVDAAMADLQSVAQQLDDIVPDAPTAEPEAAPDEETV